ncbi:MAG: carboxypeptidase-like regulatory domain-containing protein [Pseudomonadota bacterium]
MSRRWLYMPLIMLALLLAASLAMAQSDSGIISGKVVDRYGAPLKKASVRASNLDDGLVVESLTDEKGFFRMDKMSAGNYEVQVSLGPHGINKKKVKLPGGQSVKVDFVFDVREPRAVDPNYRASPPSLI